MYLGPARRLDGESGILYDSIQFGKFIYKWQDHEYILYTVVGGDGLYTLSMAYLLGTAETNDKVILEAGKWGHEIHNTVLVFDGGYWQKSAQLWRAVQDANWEDVILDKAMKKSVVGEITKFFDSRERYQKLKVPWKRGLIFREYLILIARLLDTWLWPSRASPKGPPALLLTGHVLYSYP